MKRFTALLLAACLALGTAVFAAAYNDDDYDNQNFFSIDEDYAVLLPGQDYYFPTEWLGDPIDDEFFEYYAVSISTGAPEGSDMSNAQANRYIDVAEFSRAPGGDYFFHFRASASRSYTEDKTVRVSVLARDREYKDIRSWYEMELEIGYSINEGTDTVYDSPYEVDPDVPVLEFDESLKACRLEFEDGSYYQLSLSKVRKFNLGYSEDENQAVARANPGANLKFLNFYAKPSFAKAGLLKIYAPGARYLYSIGGDNALTRIDTSPSSDYFGLTTAQLGAYVASDVALKAAAATPAAPPSSSTPSSATPTGPFNPPTGAAA